MQQSVVTCSVLRVGSRPASAPAPNWALDCDVTSCLTSNNYPVKYAVVLLLGENAVGNTGKLGAKSGFVLFET